MSTTRRTILTAAAWTAPAVALAATAPAYATSEPAPEPVCDVTAWRTNHGHKPEKGQPGTHHYYVIPACTSTVRAVWIAGEKATRHPSGVWVVPNLRGGVNQNVRVLTDEGTWEKSVRFQPEKPGGKK